MPTGRAAARLPSAAISMTMTDSPRARAASTFPATRLFVMMPVTSGIPILSEQHSGHNQPVNDGDPAVPEFVLI